MTKNFPSIYLKLCLQANAPIVFALVLFLFQNFIIQNITPLVVTVPVQSPLPSSAIFSQANALSNSVHVQ